MRKILLTAAVLGLASATMAQRNVGEARLMEPIRGLDASRAIDTVFQEILNTGNPVQYGVTDNGGYIFGTNTYGDKSKAQQFLLFGNVGASEILFWFASKYSTGTPGSIVKAKLYAMDGPGTTTAGAVNTAPGSILASVDLTMDQIDTSMNLTFTVAQFPEMVNAGSEFAAGFDMSNMATGDSIALVSTTDQEYDFAEFTWEQWSDGNWYTLPGAGWGNGTFDCALYIFVVVDDEFAGVGEESFMNNSRLSFVNGNISNGSVLLAYDVVKAGRMDLVVHNSLGQAVSETAFGNQAPGTYNHTLSTEGWAPGNYYVTIKNDGRPLTKKLFVR